MNKTQLNDKGMGLLQVLLAIGLVSGAGVMMYRSSEESKKESKGREFRTEAQDFGLQIFQILSDREACRQTLLNLNATNSTVPGSNIKDNTGTIVINNATKHGATNVQLSKIKLEDLPGLTDGVQVVPNGSGSTNLVLYFKDRAGTYYQNREYVQIFKVRVVTSSSQVQTCFAMASGVDTIWKIAGDNIYYDDGSVGVGTDNPNVALDVRGPVQISNTVGDRMTLDGNATEFEIKTSTSKPVRFQNLATGAGADLRMGALTSNEHVQVKPFTGSVGSVPCTPAIEGAIRYNARSGVNYLQLCDGTHWLDFAP